MGSTSDKGNSIVNFFEHKTILITGGTGFLAKIFLEKILRIQPNVERIYLLVKAPNSYSANKRVHDEVMAKDLFRVLKEKEGANFNLLISEKVMPLRGDISSNDLLGIQDYQIIEKMWKDMNIIVNFAATTRFDERYDVAMGVNTWGALHVLNFAKKCDCLEMFLHVSTAYVCGEKAGLIKENSLKMGETLLGGNRSMLDINAEKKLVEQMINELQQEATNEAMITMALKDLGVERARVHGWPNTYVFTKAMGEMLLGHFKDDVPVSIVRPSIITSTYCEPFPGWIEGLRTIDSIIAGVIKGKIKFLPYDPKLIFDIMPADMVVNSMILAIVARENKSAVNDFTVYHIGSSSRNPLSFNRFQEIAVSGCTKKLLRNRNGEPIVIYKVTAFGTMATFYIFMALRYQLPLKVMKLLSMTPFGRNLEDKYNLRNRKIKFVLRLVDLYKPYMFFKGIFDDTNAENLQIKASEMGMEIADGFNFNPMSIDWENYFIFAHIPGLLRYVIN